MKPLIELDPGFTKEQKVVSLDLHAEKVSLKLGGVDSSLFDLKADGLYFKETPHKDNPHDLNQDGVYRVSITAVDEALNQTKQELSIMLKNESAPPM